MKRSKNTQRGLSKRKHQTHVANQGDIAIDKILEITETQQNQLRAFKCIELYYLPLDLTVEKSPTRNSIRIRPHLNGKLDAWRLYNLVIEREGKFKQFNN